LLRPGPGAFGIDHALILKLELLQHAGSFKPRGAFNFALSHRNSIPAAGLCAASGGNHGQAVAYVARHLGVPATVFVPEVSAPVKRARIANWGAEVRVEGAQYDDAQAACWAWAERSGALVIHPYDATEVIAGQGTLGRELDQDAGGLDTVLVATGGGGLTAGVAAWFAGSGTRVVSVEPEQSCCLAAALRAGDRVTVTVAGRAADSLGARQIGALALAIARDHVSDAVTVPEDAIAAAQRALWSECRLATEPGGATALAALLCRAYVPAEAERVAVVVCGGNVDLASLAELTA
jgi:threonine dehydratase